MFRPWPEVSQLYLSFNLINNSRNASPMKNRLDRSTVTCIVSGERSIINQKWRVLSFSSSKY